ncbi:MAG: RNA methyltransferase [Fidelibacterota bacterium]|nr:MAG: RNA methyltransferase [Candidatus Neomarinimicrobiota bacterium]
MGLSQRAIKELRGLRQKKLRQAQGRFIIEGARLVTEALQSLADIEQVLLSPEFARSASGHDIESLALARGVNPESVTTTQADQLADTRHPQGVFAVVKTPPLDHQDDQPPRTPILILDGIADPGNLGTLLRTADWFSVPTVWVSSSSADALNPKVVRAGMGAHFHIPILRQLDISVLADTIFDTGVVLVGAVMDGKPLDQVEVKDDRWALVIGSEAHGLSPYWKERLHEAVTIPGNGQAESLNAAVAAGIILHYFCG